MREELFRGLEEDIHKGVVPFVADPFVMESQVQRIIDQGLTVGPGVQHHWQHLGRIDAGGRGVHQDLPGGNAHSVGAPVPDAQDAFPVGDHNQLDFPAGSPVLQGFLNVVHIVDGQVHGVLGSGEQFAVLLHTFRHPGSIEHRHEFFQVVGEQMEEQGPVPAEQLHQVMALDRLVGPFAEVVIGLFVLEFDGFHLRGQNTDQAVLFPFLPGEGRSLVQKWIIQQIITAFADCHDNFLSFPLHSSHGQVVSRLFSYAHCIH